jgi:hypothetical protein
MALTLPEAAAIEQIGALLYEFLPGSGNANTAFPIAAAKVGVAGFWPGGSKRPAIVQLLTQTLEQRRSAFCPLLVEVVRQSMLWRRGKGNPLSKEEVEHLNTLLPGVGFKIPELLDSRFLDTLPRAELARSSPAATTPSAADFGSLKSKLLCVSNLAPQPRGYAFEKFLQELFESHGLAPRRSFRLVGEQIDGSFDLASETYLLEAKWQNAQTGAGELHAFGGKIGGKATWTRGLFISQSGFTVEGLEAFSRGNRIAMVCMDGLDLFDALDRQIAVSDVIARKVRRAAETGNCFLRVRELF